MTIKAKRFKPASRVSFFTEKGEITANSKFVNKQGDVIDSDILSFFTQNDLSADSGTFRVVLTNNHNWVDVLGADDLVVIEAWRDSGEDKQRVIMMGLIDDVRKRTEVQGNTPQRQIIVTGRNFAKAFIDFDVGVVYNSNEIITSPNLGWLGGRIQFMGEGSSKIVKQVLEKLVFKYMNYTFHDGKTLQDKINMKLSNRPGEKLINQLSFVNYQGNIQAFLKEIVDEPFNEMFWESYDNNKSTLVERETPFNRDNWVKLPRHIITDEDVVMDDLGQSDLETYAFYSVGVKNYFSDNNLIKNYGVFPLWYKPYYKKFGLRRLNRMTGYVGLAGSGGLNDVQRLKKYQEDLFNWNIMNPDFYNGNLIVKGSNRYKIGDRLVYKSKEWGKDFEFYIEGVVHDFVNQSHWNTQLSVTRGLPKEGADRFKYPWGSWEVYKAGEAFGFKSSDYGANEAGVGSQPVFSNTTATGLEWSIINTAESYIGKVTYVFGGGRSQSDINSDRFDCSSFVRYVFSQNGIDLGLLGSTTTATLVRKGTAVLSFSDLQPADLVFFNTYTHNGHVGIYIGNGKFIGAQSDGCKIEDMLDDYWKPKFSTARRVI